MSDSETARSGTDQNKAVARAWIEAYVAEDTDRIRTLMKSDARWVHNGSIDISGTYEGIDSIVDDFVKGAYPLFVPGTLRIDIDQILAEGDRVAMEFSATGVSKATGKTYHNPYGLFLTFRDGLIAEAREYVDTAHGADVLYAD